MPVSALKRNVVALFIGHVAIPHARSPIILQPTYTTAPPLYLKTVSVSSGTDGRPRNCCSRSRILVPCRKPRLRFAHWASSTNAFGQYYSDDALACDPLYAGEDTAAERQLSDFLLLERILVGVKEDAP